MAGSKAKNTDKQIPAKTYLTQVLRPSRYGSRERCGLSIGSVVCEAPLFKAKVVLASSALKDDMYSVQTRSSTGCIKGLSDNDLGSNRL